MRATIGSCIVLAASLGCVSAAAADPPDEMPHGPLLREVWESKQVPPDKGPEHGDAAVTSDRYDVRRYDLALRINPEDTTLVGSVGMVFSSRENGLQSVVLDLANLGLLVDGVNNGTGDLTFTHAGDSLSVTLPVALAEGQVDSVRIAYHGIPHCPVPERGLYWRDHFHVIDSGQPAVNFGTIVANMSEPAYAKYWWPCKDRPDDKADTVRAAFTVPDTMTAVGNGLLVAETAPEPGWKTYTWLSTYPIASYLVSVAACNYASWQEDCTTALGTNIPLVNYVYHPDLADAQADLAPLCDMVEACEGWFGAYPFGREKYGHAEFSWPGAMEHQTCTSLGQSFVTGTRRNDTIILHELAHQWVGDSLTPRTWAEIWLNEGFATYAEALWHERQDGLTGYLNDLTDIRDPRDWRGDSPVYDPVPVFPGWVIYRKGAWILHMLRGRLGDDVFFPLLKDWTDGGGRPLTTVTTYGPDGFVALASQYAGEDLTAFFEPYLETDETPEIEIGQTVFDGPRGPRTQLTLDLRQIQGTLFDNLYPVRVATAAGDTTVRVRLATRRTTATFNLAGAVETVILDPQHWVLWQAGSLGEFDRLQSVYPNPARELVTFRYRLSGTLPVVVSVYDVLGRLVHRADLGVVAPTGDFAEYAWNCASDGRRVASGVYWAAVEIAGERSVRKFTVLH